MELVAFLSSYLEGCYINYLMNEWRWTCPQRSKTFKWLFNDVALNRDINPQKSIMHIAYFPYFHKFYKFLSISAKFVNFPTFRSNYVFCFIYGFLLPPYFDHDAFICTGRPCTIERRIEWVHLLGSDGFFSDSSDCILTCKIEPLFLRSGHQTGSGQLQ